MNNYAAEGWMGMATGGMEFYSNDVSSREMPPEEAGRPAQLPEYLSPEKTAQLFELPVRFGGSKASQISSNHAVVDYEIKKTGPNSRASFERK